MISGNGLVLQDGTGNDQFQSGVVMYESAAVGKVLQSNDIGLDLTARPALPNAGNGVVIENSSNSLVGGNSSSSGNIISANEVTASSSTE